MLLTIERCNEVGSLVPYAVTPANAVTPAKAANAANAVTPAKAGVQAISLRFPDSCGIDGLRSFDYSTINAWGRSGHGPAGDD